MNTKINEKEVKQILLDMVYETPIEVYRKYGIGIQTQEEIKKLVERRDNYKATI